MQKRRKLKVNERQAVYDKFAGHCAYCGCEITIKDMQVDHIKALELGGTDEVENMYPACRSCNHYKHTLTLEKFRKALEHMPDVLLRDNVTYRNAVRYGLVQRVKEHVDFYFEKYSKTQTEKTDNVSIIVPFKVGGLVYVVSNRQDEYGYYTGEYGVVAYKVTAMTYEDSVAIKESLITYKLIRADLQSGYPKYIEATANVLCTYTYKTRTDAENRLLKIQNSVNCSCGII